MAGWDWAKSVGGTAAGAKIGTAIAPGVGTAIGAGAGFLWRGLQDTLGTETPDVKELGIMTPDELREHLKAESEVARGDELGLQTRALAGRGGLRSGQLASSMSDLRAKQQARIEGDVGRYRTEFDRIKMNIASRQSYETRDFFNNVLDIVLTGFGEEAKYTEQLKGLADIMGGLGKEEEKRKTPYWDWKSGEELTQQEEQGMGGERKLTPEEFNLEDKINTKGRIL